MTKTKIIKRVLMCRPTYYTVEYVIEPWMKPGTANTKLAMQQWEKLVEVYKKLEIKVEIIEQRKGLPDMIFATDQGIARGRKVLVSRFKHKERKGETQFYEQWFFEHAYEILHLPPNHYFEGNGESYFWNNYLFVGTGYRSDTQTAECLTKIFHHEVIPLHIIDPLFYHLDVGFFPLNNETVFYYPNAYTQATQEKLKKIIPNLIPFTKAEAMGFSANSVVTDKYVIMEKGNPTFKKKIEQLGYETIEVDTGEFKKGGGGVHCLTNILEEIEITVHDEKLYFR